MVLSGGSLRIRTGRQASATVIVVAQLERVGSRQELFASTTATYGRISAAAISHGHSQSTPAMPATTAPTKQAERMLIDSR